MFFLGLRLRLTTGLRTVWAGPGGGAGYEEACTIFNPACFSINKTLLLLIIIIINCTCFLRSF